MYNQSMRELLNDREVVELINNKQGNLSQERNYSVDLSVATEVWIKEDAYKWSKRNRPELHKKIFRIKRTICKE